MFVGAVSPNVLGRMGPVLGANKVKVAEGGRVAHQTHVATCMALAAISRNQNIYNKECWLFRE